jgi:hypothetical protein
MRATVFLSLLLAASVAGAEEGSVTVEAQGTGVGATDDAACAEAQRGAMRTAAEQGSGVTVISDTTVKNTLLVRDVILTQAQGFVSGVKVLDTRKGTVTGDAKTRECTVRISATVEKSKVEGALKKLAAGFAARGRPKVLVMVAEQSVGMTQPAAWWEGGQKREKGASYKSTDIRQVETRMMETMQTRGWSFVDPQVITGKLQLAGPVSANPDNAQLREFGKLAEAEFVIYGFASADEPSTGDFGGGADTAIVSVPSKIAARVVATDSGEIYATYTGTATGSGFSASKAAADSFRKLSDEAVLKLERQVVDRWLSEAYGTQRVALTVRGVKDYKTLVDFKAALQSGVPAVKEINQRPYSSGEGRFDLQCEGSAENVADRLATASFKGYGIRIDKVTQGVIEVTLTPGK